MSINDEKTYTPVKQLARFHIESKINYPTTVWYLIALHIGETLEQHGCIVVRGQNIDLTTTHRPFGPYVLKFELFVMNGQSFHSRERMMSELRSFIHNSGANNFEIDFENVR